MPTTDAPHVLHWPAAPLRLTSSPLSIPLGVVAAVEGEWPHEMAVSSASPVRRYDWRVSTDVTLTVLLAGWYAAGEYTVTGREPERRGWLRVEVARGATVVARGYLYAPTLDADAARFARCAVVEALAVARDYSTDEGATAAAGGGR